MMKFTGPKTKEEKEKELTESQRVLEARARERQVSLRAHPRNQSNCAIPPKAN
jgi:hypothetical protein